MKSPCALTCKTQMGLRLSWTVIVLFAHLLPADGGTSGRNKGFHASMETKLIDNLLRRYKDFNPHLVRPVMNASNTMWVQFGIGLIQLLDFNEKEQMLTTLLWKRYTWKDEFLTWDPADYDGIDNTLIPAAKLWVPDILLYNNAGDMGVEDHQGQLVVDYTGNVVWIPTVRYSSSCSVDMTDFPFDEQTCRFRFGSWTHNTAKLDLEFYNNTASTDLTNFVSSSEWAIVQNEAERRELKYPCCPSTYSDVVFTLRFKRQVTFHMRLILVPTILLTLLSCAIFWIPPNRPDRTTLGLGLFSSFFLLLILVLNNSPPVRESKLGSFYVIVILLVSFGVLYSVFIINISIKETRTPAFIDKFLLSFGCCLCCSTAIHEVRQPLDGLSQTSLLCNGRGAASSTPGKSSTQHKIKWQKFALIVDHFVFVIFLGCIILSYVTVFPCALSIINA